MDNNHLTPNKIQRLIHLAEDKSFGVPTPSRHNLIPGDVYRSTPFKPVQVSLNCESSSGILDVDKLDAFGESGLGLGNFSLSKSTAFNPGEMTGRSTGTEDIVATPAKTFAFEASLAIDNIASHANKQTSEINDIMRQSIATNYSFHSKRDLTADEASLIMREAPIPIPMSQFTPFPESAMSTASEISVGTYFKNRCTDFGNILKHTDSPDRASMTDATPSCIENALNNYDVYKMDPCLDNVPVKEPRSPLANKKKGHKSPSQSPIANKVVPLTKSNQCNQNVNRNNPPPPTFQGMKPTDILIKNLQASLRPANEDTEGSVENSMSISKIADYLGKESNVSVTDMLKYGKRKSPKKPLAEINMNSHNNNTTRTYGDVTVTTLKDTRQMDTASSTDTCNTVITVENLKITDQNVPSIVVSGCGEATNAGTTKSKSPSCKTTPTLSTVWESSSSFKLNETPQRVSKGDRSPSSHDRLSRSIVYKELDKSVDWQDVLQHKYTNKEECLAKEQWAEISTTPANGYVGVSAAVGMKITTLTDNWLTARIQFDLKELNKEVILELPRSPMLLSPKKTETFTIYLTSNIELHTTLKYALHLKDASVDKEIEQTGDLNVNIRVPTIQALSNDGFNKLNFSSIQENTSLTKSFVLISDCPVGLQLELSVVEGESLFVIRSIQEIMKCDVNRIVGEQQGLVVEGKCRSKSKKQLCRLVSGNAIRVTITFNAPRLSELQIKDPLVTFKGALHVNLFDVNCVLKKVDLLAVVGVAQLHISVCEKLQVSKEGTLVTLTNKGSIPAIWSMKVLPKTLNDMESPFKVIPDTVKIKGGESKNITVAYTGPDDISHEATLVFENVGSIKNPSIDIVGGTDKPKAFPIKTNFNNMSWVRSERKELSLKNSTDRKIRIRCRVLGEGFQIDLPGVDTRGSMILTFEAQECRPLPLLFAPTNPRPHVASLNLVYDNELSRKVKLHGCASDWGGGGPGLRWSGLVTYGDTALVRAVSRAPIHLHLANKSNAPAFICASLHFNLQYMFLSGHTAVSGARCVVRARSTHVVAVSPAWALVERRSHIAHTSALGTLKALTGHELTRRRILKILRNESNGVLDTTLIPDNLRVLVETFADEDPAMDSELAEFQETKASLNELISGIQELTAQIDLPQEFQEDATIVIADDTALVEHHTLLD